jgi:ribosome biogenesis GTPase
VSKKKKIRIAFRKGHEKSAGSRRRTDSADESRLEDLPAVERISGKGAATRHRTVLADDDSGTGRAVGGPGTLTGRVVSPRGFECLVAADDGREFTCTVRRVVRTIASQDRTAIAAGDRVLFSVTNDSTGVIERVEPRTGAISRNVRGQRQVIVANVEQLLIVASAVDPPIKPSLIDRYIISGHVGGLKPIICVNKADLADLGELQPLVGMYAQLGYQVLLTSAVTGMGVARLRQLLTDRETALSGQSGVGKSSLVNAIEPDLKIRTLTVSKETGKGRHTTTNATLLRLSGGGWVVDTPGIRQLDLWNVSPAEIVGCFIEFRPFLSQCRFPDCSHKHEQNCGVKRAVAAGFISALRYESYCRISGGDVM